MRRWPRGAALMALAIGCQAAGGRDAGAPAVPSADPAAQSYAGPALPRARVTLKDAYGGAHNVDVEVAATPSSRERGLMWRTSLADGQGMIFLFPRAYVQSFWMKNTLIPLDMLFISPDRTIVGIVENAEPKTLSPRGVPFASSIVLEVPGGWCARMGIQAGSRIDLEGLGSVAVSP